MAERTDGRTADQLRPVRITPGYIAHAEGSALFEIGNTRVVCTCSVEDRVPPFLRGQGQGWVTAEYGMLPRATPVRTQREATKGKQSGRTAEIQRLIGRSLRAVIDMKSLGERTLWIDCDVITADGGTRTASITGAYVAMVGALHQLRRSGALRTLPVVDYLAAISTGVVNGEPLLDLAYVEDSRAQVDMNVVMTGRGLLVEAQATGEGGPFGRDQHQVLLDLAAQGVTQLVAAQQEALGPLAREVGRFEPAAVGAGYAQPGQGAGSAGSHC